MVQRMTIPRVLEPELMDDPAEAESYDAMDHSQVNRAFVQELLAGGPVRNPVLDLGTGTALIPIELCRQSDNCRLVASDAAEHMLQRAIRNIQAAGVQDRITVHQGDSKRLEFQDSTFGCVISNSLAHHLAEPLLAMREMLRVLEPGGRLFVRDLLRPESQEDIARLVNLYAREETPFNQQLLRQSLHAALTLAEIRQIVVGLGFPEDSVRATSDRHWTWDAIKG